MEAGDFIAVIRQAGAGIGQGDDRTRQFHGGRSLVGIGMGISSARARQHLFGVKATAQPPPRLHNRRATS